MAKFIDLTGVKFGRLAVIKQAGRNKRGQIVWSCECDCGKEVVVCGASLRRGNTRSCGCLQRERAIEYNTKHGGKGTRLYKTWKGIKERCFNPNKTKYSIYGGRGITICDEWKNDFKAFREWAMANGYNDTLTIDRIDANGNYEPSNCRWATQKEQQNNKRNNHLITFNGETHTLTEWASIKNIPRRTLQDRIYKGWKIEKSLIPFQQKVVNVCR